MKPHRLTLTNSLVMNYGLYKKMKVNQKRLLIGSKFHLKTLKLS